MEEAQQRVCRRCVTVEKTVHTLEDKLRTAEDETQSLQNEVLRKKGEMVRLMSSIQLARAQVSGCGHVILTTPTLVSRLVPCTRDYDNQATTHWTAARTLRFVSTTSLSFSPWLSSCHLPSPAIITFTCRFPASS